jgi:hypothetical protein
MYIVMGICHMHEQRIVGSLCVLMFVLMFVCMRLYV